jgi:hypothetical protein
MMQQALGYSEFLDAVEDLVWGCQAIIRATGGSDRWHGETHKALAQIESALERCGVDVEKLKQEKCHA